MIKKLSVYTLVMVLWAAITAPAHAGLGDFLEDLKSTFTQDEALSNTDIISGLKQALEVGTNNAVAIVSKTDGYFKSPHIKIPLPENVQKVAPLLNTVGLGDRVTAFELSMNRAAEKAAPLAVDIFIKAISQMSFKDARNILNGADDAATSYFKRTTWNHLHQTFKPMISQAMADVGVTRRFQELNDKLAAIPFAEQLRFDLDQYTTDKGLEGLFYMLALEEKKIRKDPAARITDLLQKVFGGK